MGEIASSGQLRMSYLRWSLVLVPLLLLLGVGSGLVAGSGEENPWFRTLTLPDLQPEGSVFGAVWTVLYVLQGLALALVVNARGSRYRGLAILLFIVQFALSLAWSPLFFGSHQVTSALYLLVAILVAAVVTTVAFARVRRLAAGLMLPYLAWLCFAAFLNYQVDVLNPDAETLAPGSVDTQIQL